MPDTLPVFPLAGVLLLPYGQLPLNVFEKRYVSMVDDALRGDRLIGMIQPRLNGPDLTDLYDTGCAGRIKSFSETDDGRYMITLTGLSRFRVEEELPQVNGYRRVRPDWTPYKKDFDLRECLDLDRDKLRAMLRGYFEMNDLSCDWETIDGASDASLITCLSMICPFDPGEKQALLEAPCGHTRAEKFMMLLKMALHGDCKAGCHH
jgi:Lon protease-like protein